VSLVRVNVIPPAAGHCHIGRIYPQYRNDVKVRAFCSNCSMILGYLGTIGQACGSSIPIVHTMCLL